ncbi:hypothetical protein F5Y17DRAFT_477173 [Xylariaceae sp. FL0594]|nr:hypothetical protein F5Y17DRAFT_477173 [Xylariaceae sp. FL0594]
MSSIVSPEAVVGVTIACSFILFGNAITQSFMGVPILLVDFPSPSREEEEEHAARARLLGRQWPVFWRVGNVFFRPISTFGILGYGWDARVFALAALCHLITVVHSAVNMQPINEKIEALSRSGGEGVSGSGKVGTVQTDAKLAEHYARKWIRYNTVRLITPVVAGTLALTQVLKR